MPLLKSACLVTRARLVAILVFAQLHACGSNSGNSNNGAKKPDAPAATQPTKKNTQNATPRVEKPKPSTSTAVNKPKEDVAQVVKELEAMALKGFPDMTVFVGVKDAASARARIEKEGGRIEYDPNLGRGSAIPFLIVTLPPSVYGKAEFFKDIGLIDISVASSTAQVNVPKAELVPTVPVGDVATIRVPYQEVGVERLRQRNPGQGLGEGVTIAVLDTGIDASHSVFGDRVVYWSDETQEGRVSLSEASVEAGEIKLSDSLKLKAPAAVVGKAKVFAGVIDEKAMGVQGSVEERAADKAFYDVNYNGRADKLGFVVYEDSESGEWVAIIDTDGNGEFSEKETQTSIMDFNRWRASKGKNPGFTGFLSFKANNKTLKFPVLIERDSAGAPKYLTVAIDKLLHGTHVAGIAAGGGSRIEGAAPKANLMAIKVCSGLSCTTAAMLRGLVKAFYNEQGLVPDVVNLSLGSAQGYDETIFDKVIRDLTAKFGTVFFISASNEGPGYRSINDFGSNSPAVLVGAHASRQTLEQHYRLNPQVALQQNNLLFFSSVGPSFTGELRPNLVAPGSAVSSIPMAGGRSAMFNGTSMSSPLAAGAAGALISALKKDPSYEPLDAVIQKRRAYYQALAKQSTPAEGSPDGSLNTFVYSFRTVLEESSSKKDFADYGMAQVGFGLMDVDAAFPLMKERAVKLMEASGAQLFSYAVPSLKINRNTKADRLYDRAIETALSKTVTFSLNEDGEETENELEGSELEPITVKLVAVEEQLEDGTVNVLQGSAVPFSIGDTMTNTATESTVILNNKRKDHFYSIRRPEKMQEGRTYTARYDLIQNGIRFNTLLDVVHRPIVTTDSNKEYRLPALNIEPFTARHSFGRANQKIAAGKSHRFPLAVLDTDSHFEVDLAVDSDQEGQLMVLIYDPDGRQTYEGAIQKAIQKSSKERTISVRVETLAKKGIYEIVVANNNGDFLVDTSYDLFVRKIRYLSSWPKISLKAGSEKIVVFSDIIGTEVVKSVTPVLFTRVYSFGKAKVMPSTRTFKKLELPESLKDLSSIALEIKREPGQQPVMPWNGSIAHQLFTVGKDGKAEAVKGIDSGGKSDESRGFSKIDFKKQPLFAGLDTYSTVADEKKVSEGVTEVELVGNFQVPSISEEVTATRDSLSSSPYADVYTLTAPDELRNKDSYISGLLVVQIERGARLYIPMEVTP